MAHNTVHRVTAETQGFGRPQYEGGTGGTGGAVFRRKLTTSHAELGGLIKDAPVSLSYPDVFSGDGEIFKGAESLSTGQLPVGNYSFATDYLIEFPFLNSPRFGEASLRGLELNLYFSDLNYKRDFHTSSFKIFKMKEEVGGNADGIFGSLQTADLFFASARPDKTPLEVETFSEIKQSANLIPTPSGSLFVNAEVAFNNLDNSITTSIQSWGVDKEEFLAKYAQDYLGEQVVFLEPYYSLGSGYTYINSFGKAAVQLGNWITGYSAEWPPDTSSRQRYRTVERTGGFDPDWGWGVFGNNLRTTGGYVTVSKEALTDIAITTDNTFFDKIRFSAPRTGALQSDGTYAMEVFSFPQVTQDGLLLTARWAQAAPALSLTFGSSQPTFQSIMLTKALPHPASLIREKGASTVHKEGLEIDIRFKIDELPIMERLDDTTTGLRATRGFFITLATSQPSASEHFSEYLSQITSKTKIHRKLGSGNTHNNLWAFGIMSFKDTTPTADSSDGKLMVVTSGSPTGATQSWIDGGSSGPYIYTSGSSRTSAGNGPLYGNGSYDATNAPSFGEWVNLKIVISSSHTRVGYILTNDNDEIIWSRKDERAYFTPNDLTTTTNGDGFPKYMNIWLNNSKIGKNSSEFTDGYYTSTALDAVAKVTIKSITISNVTCDVLNATNAEYNKSFLRMPTIDSESSSSLIQTDDLSNSTTTGSGHFGSSNSYGENLYETLGILHDDGGAPVDPTLEGLIPSYLIFGTTTSNHWLSQDTNLFLGAFNTENLEYSDDTDTSKHMKVQLSAPENSDVILYASDDAANLGEWLAPIKNDNINQNTGTSRLTLRSSLTNAAMEVRYFTRNGFIRFDVGGGGIHTSNTFTKRECPFLAAKIIKVTNAKSGEIVVADASGLLGKPDEEYIIYRIGKAWDAAGTYYKSGVKLKKNPNGLGVLSLDTNVFNSNNGSKLCAEQYMDELYISPFRFWLIMEMYNVSESSNEILPAFSYGHALLLNDSTPPASTTKGLTYNELLYSDSPYYQNSWSLVISKSSSIETEIDYGFGTIEDEGEGYLAFNKVSKESDFTLFDVSGLLQDIEKFKKDERVTFFMGKDIISKGSAKLSTTGVSSSTQKPFLTFVYEDELPSIEDFKVQPNEDDPFYPQYTWSTKDDDLWYGFLILDELSIEHQYHSAVAHIPLSEKNAIADGTKTYLYRYDGAYNGTGVVGSGASFLTNTLEGLAGYALDFDGSTERYVYWDDGTYTDPTSNASFVAHVVVDNANATHYIVSKKKQFEIYIDSGGKINAKLYYSSTASANLQSFSVVPEDGETPTNIIVTFDASLAVGNCRLFINGKLEDQSGIKTTDGSTHNWKTGATLNETGTEKLIIGMQDDSGYTNHFNGHIEEVVIYNKTIYPVVPQTGELTIYKQPWELTVGDVAAGKSIVGKLFIKDYHNIRGTTTNEVASTSMVAYRKSGVGLKTN